MTKLKKDDKLLDDNLKKKVFFKYEKVFFRRQILWQTNLLFWIDFHKMVTAPKL